MVLQNRYQRKHFQQKPTTALDPKASKPCQSTPGAPDSAPWLDGLL